MTEEEMQVLWFEGMKNYIPNLTPMNKIQSDFWEGMYQAFKARLKSEATCNCWPKEAVRESRKAPL